MMVFQKMKAAFALVLVIPTHATKNLKQFAMPTPPTKPFVTVMEALRISAMAHASQ